MSSIAQGEIPDFFKIMTKPEVDCLPEERQRLIVELLARDGRVVAQDLARQFGASEDTIRRDLRELAAAGLCRRVYGGALPLPLPLSPAGAALGVRLAQMPGRKQALGTALVALLEAGQTVFVDAGSTNLAALRALPADLRLTIVTNSPLLAAELAGKEAIELIVVGGRVDRRSGAAFGARALRDIAELRPDVYLLGSCALDADSGIAAYGFDEAEFKRALIASARRVVSAATNDKLASGAPFVVAPLRILADLVLEADAPAALASSLKACGVVIHHAAAIAGSGS